MDDRFDDPEDLVWSALERLNLPDNDDWTIYPKSLDGLIVVVDVPGAPVRSIELDENRLREIIERGDSAAVDTAIAGISDSIELSIREVIEARERERSRGAVIALDVDGVLNVDVGRTSLDELGPGWNRHQVEVPAAEVPDSPFVAGYGKYPLSLPVVLNSGLHGTWITAMRERAEVVWATTWEESANRHLAPLLGIDPLPVGISAAIQKPRFGIARDGNTPLWKAMALRHRYRGRPLVWVDDLNRSVAEDWCIEEATLIVTTDPQVGLTEDQMAEIGEFVDAQRPQGTTGTSRSELM